MEKNCQEESRNNPITISVASTLREKMEVYRFRYRVYIEELAMQIDNADHERKMIFDEGDREGLLIYARVGGDIVGTQRLNIGTINEFPSDLAHFLSWDRFQSCYGGRKLPILSYTSKLMVAEQYRNTPVLHLITAKGYELYCDYNVQFNFGACNFHLLRLYEQFGCRRYGSSFTAPGYDGVVTPVVLIVNDIQHLRAVRSPFYRLARKRGDISQSLATWFYAEFKESSDLVNSQLISEEELWLTIVDRLGCLSKYHIPIFQGLSLAEIKKLIFQCGILVKYRDGEPITTRNASSHTHKILISGMLNKTDAFGFNEMIMPGQSFGASGLVGHAPYSEDVVAATASEVLIFSSLNFERFRYSHPDIAFKVIQNLKV